jgi:hypothetical protein
VKDTAPCQPTHRHRFRFGQVVDPTSPSYTRPSPWRRQVAPAWLLMGAAFGTFVILLLALTATGLDDPVPFVVASGVGQIVQGATELWWRRNRPPSADRPHRRLISRSGSGD